MELMMKRRQFVSLAFAGLALSACLPITSRRSGGPAGDGPLRYRINPDDTAEIQFRVLDSVNALRRAAGAPVLALSPELNAAAATHSRDMSLQNRPWHFGSDGSSPIDRAQRAGYRGTVLGENISETYEAEVETIAAWMQQPDTADVIVDPAARDLGIAFYQEDNGKIWWTLLTGDGGQSGPANAPQG